jgi:hypothetical protein
MVKCRFEHTINRTKKFATVATEFSVIKNPKIIIAFLSGLLLISCGIFESDYVNYNDEAGGEDPNDPAVLAAVAEFEAQIQPSLSGCAVGGCHLNATGTPMGTDATANRKEWHEYANCNAELIFKKLSGDPSHTGADQSSNVPLAKIEAWIAKEPSCSSP